MITQEHLEHWIKEIQWQLNGLHKELNKKGYVNNKGLVVDGDFLSLEYLREKTEIAIKTLHCIEWDILHDELESIDQILKNQRIAEQVLKAKKQVDDYWEAVETQPTPDVMIQGYYVGQKDLIKKIMETNNAD